MQNNPKIVAVLKINILDSPIKGIIYLVAHKNHFAGICLCRGHKSPVFDANTESESYHQCREWFMSNYDGFVQVNKLSGDEELEEIKRFESLKSYFN